MSKEPPSLQPHLWDGTPMAAMPYVISKEGDMPTHHDETLLDRYQREHRVYEGMNMSKAEELANMLDDLYAVDERPIDKETSTELRRLSAINAELLEALSFYADKTRYHGPNQSLREPDAWSEKVGLTAYRLDVTRDQGCIAFAAIAKVQGEQQ